ncbi:hypothetical protein TSMEX_001255 [Taenia solium]|eukprot:TsM_000911100 transcript=TsM_000911100 gene=TsM_000911100
MEDDATELVASTVADAAHYLDVALGASRRLHESTTTTTTTSTTSPSHLFFTLNVYRNHSGGTVIIPTPPWNGEAALSHHLEESHPDDKVIGSSVGGSSSLIKADAHFHFGAVVEPQGHRGVHDKCVEIQMPPCRRCGNEVVIEKTTRRMERISLDAISPTDLYPSNLPMPTARCLRSHQADVKKETSYNFGFAENLSTRPRFPRFIKDTKHIQCRHCKDEVDRIALMEFLRLEHECEMQSNARRGVIKARKAKDGRKVREPLTHSTPLKTSPLPPRANRSA